MAVQKINPTNFITEEVTFSYAHLFVPKPNQEGILKYSVCILLDKTNKSERARWDAAIESAIQMGIAKGMFTANQRPILKTPIRDGDEELKTEMKKGLEYKARWFVNANANVTDREGNPVPPPAVTKPSNGIAVPILDPLEMYSGCKGRAIISFYPFANKSKGIAVAVNGVYKTKDGDRLDGRVDAISAFAQFAAEEVQDEEGGTSEFE